MIALGIDPGLRIAGFGVLKKENRRITILDCGYLRMSPNDPIPHRIATFHDFIAEKITSYQVTDIAIETPFLGKNAYNFLKLGYLRGIVYLLSVKHSVVLHEFGPCEVKQAVTGFGGASKEQVARAIMQLFPLLDKPDKEDVTDALAVTLCSIWRQPPLVKVR